MRDLFLEDRKKEEMEPANLRGFLVEQKRTFGGGAGETAITKVAAPSDQNGGANGDGKTGRAACKSEKASDNE